MAADTPCMTWVLDHLSVETYTSVRDLRADAAKAAAKVLSTAPGGSWGGEVASAWSATAA